MKYFYSDFFKRVDDSNAFNSDLYKKRITSKIKDVKATCLFEDCFSNHVKYDDFSVKQLTFNKDENAKRHINQDILSAYFINQIYKVPAIVNCDSDGKEKVEFSDYIKNISNLSFTEGSQDRFKLGTNTVRYIVGDVGSGKTAFIKKSISEIRNQPKDNYYDVVPVYINLEEQFHYGVEPTPLKLTFMPYLFRKIREAVMSQISRFDAAHINAINPEKDPELAIKILCATLKEQKIRLILFIDNLDFYHYIYARYAFFDRYYKNQFESIQDNIVWLINLFESADGLGILGLNVVIATRDYVYDDIATNAYSIKTQIDTSEAISLQKIPEEVIVASRLDLLEEAIKVVGKSNKGAGNIMQLMLQPLIVAFLSKQIKSQSYSNTPIGKIYRLGQHGYRSLVHFLSSLSLSYQDTELMNRFLVNPVSSLEILYINNLYRNYSQSQNHFPNMFLIDCTVIQNSEFEDAHQTHMHTYWLKYFVLKYIADKKKVKVSELVRVFVKIGEYDEHVVRHVIGSLCTANEFRCAEIESFEDTQNIDSRKLMLTERGKAILEKSFDIEFCFQFLYLETIIDDKWLNLPIPYFENIYDGKSDYQLLYSVDREFVNKSVENVLSKAKKILYFITVLKAAYDEEVRKRKTHLDKILVQEKLVPDLEYLALQIIQTAEHIITTGLKKEDNASLEGIKALYVIRDELKKDESIRLHLSKYYDSNIKIGE